MAQEDAGQPVVITADRLLADMNGRAAEFVGQVRAAQEGTVITAARLKLVYASPAEGTAADADEAAIERIEASGEVVIRFEDRVAEADRAVYTTADRVLVLTGETARLTSGPNVVTGGRITFERDTDRLTVEKVPGGRVEAVFITRGQGLR